MNKNRKLPRKVYESPRLATLELLVQVAEENAYSNLLVKTYLTKHRLSDKDGRLMTEIVYGTISRRMTLEYGLTDFVEDTSKIEVWVRELLLLSMYQMEYLDKVPVYSVISEAVEIAKAKGNQGIARYVNGVLRSIQRQGPRPTSEIKNRLKRLSTEISLPKWLTKKLIEEIGYEEAEQLGYSLLEPSKVSARVDSHQISLDEAVERLNAEGIQAEKSQVSPYGVVAQKGFLAGSSLFKEGALTIQDESSMLVAPSMQLESHHKVLDACAAPGGKTVHIASFLDKEAGGEVVALDIYDHKINLIEENAQRLGVSDVVTTKLLDARDVKDNFEDEFFDRVLVDAPCSGLGLLRRKPDIKYNKSAQDFLALQEVQLEILESVVTKVKEWGIITYSTCTITPEENQEVIAKFLEKHPNFEKIDVEGATTLEKSYQDQMLQLYPHHYQTDGFFICCLQRKA
ncbi:16S rRNA (cytosine(967)-C(5))-methyltransferase RsmB [Vagococcus sp. DIV0080]|uniref:16S rRNA (cytosine(967)-C(5))-methyltransferase n=1 Tax=Candidatus Vagococcus giribetii TaxID=2230876 RepID=A0ABS3HTI0_9ENTE|nr:16S rRNA (cytosine(967)-C(5))-methyltransferase RsmB [Vagococcus sp. DIV0080]MBO0477019.1 16S rRNA (cytosine(967)-C(5))-methyltransferase RsmB [Vagococcus sp. DIV0080]